MIRSHDVAGGMMQTESPDAGRTWTAAEPLDILGLPPHLLRHASPLKEPARRFALEIGPGRLPHERRKRRVGIEQRKKVRS
jgi:hypothetical protein